MLLLVSSYLYIQAMKKQSNRKSPRMSGEERRNSIIDAAFELFSRKGFSGTRTREIAARAGISETLLFQHFKTKQALYSEVFKHVILYHPPVAGISQAVKARDDAGLLRAIALHAVEHSRHDPRIIRLSLFGSLEGLRLRDEPTDKPTMSGVLACYIEQRIKEGVFRPVNSHLAARLFIDSILMFLTDQRIALTGPALPDSDENAVETLVDIFINGLKSTE